LSLLRSVLAGYEFLSFVGLARDSEGLRDGLDCRLDMLARCLPVQDADSHGASASPGGSSEKDVSLGQNALDDLVGAAIVVLFACVRRRIKKTHQSLVDLGLPHYLRVRQGSDARNKRAGVRAAAVNQISYSGAAA